MCKVNGNLPRKIFWSSQMNAAPSKLPNLCCAGPKLRASCNSCQTLLEEQQQLFAAFETMPLPAPTTSSVLQFEPLAQQGKIWSSQFPSPLSFLAMLFLCTGSGVQLFRESGFSWYWIADGRRLETVSSLLYSTPLLSAALTLMGLIFCLTLNTHENSGNQL